MFNNFIPHFGPKFDFRNVYSYPSIIIFTLSMFCWYLVDLNFWKQEEGGVDHEEDLAEQFKEGVKEEYSDSNVDLRDDGSTVDLPLMMIFLAGIMLFLLMLQFYRNLALR